MAVDDKDFQLILSHACDSCWYQVQTEELQHWAGEKTTGKYKTLFSKKSATGWGVPKEYVAPGTYAHMNRG